MGLSADEFSPSSTRRWLTYFPPLGRADLKKFGAWSTRRSFITTDYNAYYDSFVRWQFGKLRAADVIAFGKRPSIFSEADGQPCMDHDRDKGEGVGPQEYVALKLQVLEPFPEVLAPLKGKTVYCLAGTLRPETMCGQTNCWILPEGDYGAFEARQRVYICGARGANMGFQDVFGKWVARVPANDQGEACSARVKAPLTKYDEIYMLPLTTISMTRGRRSYVVPPTRPTTTQPSWTSRTRRSASSTGCRPSGSSRRADQILETPDLGPRPPSTCAKMKISSQKDVEKLRRRTTSCTRRASTRAS